MADECDEVVRQILRNYRHLMSEAERRAHRAFAFQEMLQGITDAAKTAEMTAAMQQALEDPLAAELYQRGRPQFLRDLSRRILAKHGTALPHCARCGGVLKTPNPKLCITCDFSGEESQKDQPPFPDQGNAID